MTTDKEKIYLFIKHKMLAVIATTNTTTPYPESALVAFTEEPNLTLYFQTHKESRKANNIKGNPHVAFVIGLELQDKGTVQYQGLAEQLVEEEEVIACKKRFLEKKSPTDETFLNRPDAIFFKVTPVWIGYWDYSGEKTQVIELKLALRDR